LTARVGACGVASGLASGCPVVGAGFFFDEKSGMARGLFFFMASPGEEGSCKDNLRSGRLQRDDPGVRLAGSRLAAGFPEANWKGTKDMKNGNGNPSSDDAD
jgi:hypothetical protein